MKPSELDATTIATYAMYASLGWHIGKGVWALLMELATFFGQWLRGKYDETE